MSFVDLLFSSLALLAASGKADDCAVPRPALAISRFSPCPTTHRPPPSPPWVVLPAAASPDPRRWTNRKQLCSRPLPVENNGPSAAAISFRRGGWLRKRSGTLAGSSYRFFQFTESVNGTPPARVRAMHQPHSRPTHLSAERSAEKPAPPSLDPTVAIREIGHVRGRGGVCCCGADPADRAIGPCRRNEIVRMPSA